MAWNKEEKEEVDFAEWLRIITSLIHILIYVAIGIWWLVEFAFNPHHNVSTFFLAEHTYGMAVQCQGEYQRWEIRDDAIDELGGTATVNRWKVDRDGVHVSEEVIGINKKNDLTFPCGDEEVVAGLVWSVDQEEGIHFRAPRSFEIWEIENRR